MKRRLILYDLDGTLVDTRPDIAAADQYVLARLGGNRLSAADIERFPEQDLRGLLRQEIGADTPELVAEAERLFATYWSEHPFERSVLYPGTRELLDYFCSRRQAVLTRRPRFSCDQLLQTLGVANYFADVVAGDSQYSSKPDPAGAQAIMQRAGVSAQDALLIGDSPLDIEAGRRAGIFTVAVSHGIRSTSALRAMAPDVLVNDLVQLLQLARQNGW